jgi:predicted flap endonuclease-1-like 5' DNA nuclease
VIREAEAASEVVETPDVTVLSLEVVEPAAGQVVAGAVDVPSVEVTVAEPSTAELVARSLANGPIPSEPASAGAVVVPDLEAEVVAAEPALQARAFEVEAQAPQVEISEFAAYAPAGAAMAGAAAAERLAPVATHVEANAEETVGEVWPEGPVEAVVAPVLEPAEAEMPPVVTEIPEAVAPEFAVMAPAETEATLDTATETAAVELEVAGPEAEVAPAEPAVAPPDEELGQLRSQFAALETEISGLERATPAPRLLGSEEAARVAAEMAALKTADASAAIREERLRTPAKLRSRLAIIEGIGEAYGAKLEGLGIRTPEALLTRGATRKGREEIAEQSGISDNLILRWVNHADMFRVSGIGSEYADLLEAAGVDTVVELASRVPANLHAKLVATNQEKKLVRQVPVLWQVERWVAAAKLLPGVVTY